jgi:hypothetical protein
MRGAVLAFCSTLTLCVPSVGAQTLDDAVWANAALALQLCNAGTVPSESRAAWFRNAGFAETVQRSPTNSDTTHWFSAPAKTVTVELYYGEMPEHCLVASRHMGVGRANQLLDAIIPQIFPGFLRREQPGSGVVCVTYEDPTNPIGLIIGVVSGTTSDCRDDGTVEFYSTARV